MPIMTDEPKEPHVENIPSVSGKISAIASANAPFIYFEDARFFGVGGGIGKIAVSTSRQIALNSDDRVMTDHVLVGHLVGNFAAIRSLRAACDGILLMIEPKPEGPAN
jgi:hypothetical protein